jgi:peptidoglycan/xylan/chitin deacetylase (PgdA/CDA1 family)
MPYIVTTPWWLRLTFSKHCLWDIPPKGKELYLTFDDGPHPTITPRVLDLLNEYKAKATFFCIGKNVEAYPDIYRRIIDEGHRVGNHTYSHLNSKRTDESAWLEDVRKAVVWIDSDLFRPPYGRISRFQEKALREAKPGYRTIMWSVLSGDFDKNLSAEECTKIVCKHSKPGSIIIFHDSEKAWPRLELCLPETLKRLSDKGFVFNALK